MWKEVVVIIAREKFIKVLSRVVTVRWRRDIFILPDLLEMGETGTRFLCSFKNNSVTELHIQLQALVPGLFFYFTFISEEKAKFWHDFFLFSLFSYSSFSKCPLCCLILKGQCHEKSCSAEALV